jgi:hypothetical protein
MTTAKLTPASLDLFLALANDAGNWSGMPLIGGNVQVTKAQRGNLTDLQEKGLIQLQYCSDTKGHFAAFTDSGKALAAEHGITIDDYL